MTNHKEYGDHLLNPRQAAVQAVHLVSEILEEASITASTATNSRDPWRYITCLKKYKTQDETYNQNLTFIIPKDNLRNNKLESPIITSTPQKGQGDQEFETIPDDNMVKSTSMFITQLFDMSDLEDADELDVVEDNKESDNSLNEHIIKIIDACVKMSVCEVFALENSELSEEKTDDSSYLHLSDAVNFSEINDVINNLDENNNSATKATFDSKCSKTFDIENNCAMNTKINENIEVNNDINDLRSYENAYLSLNRDYEQYLDIEPITQDPKQLSLQEIDLWPEETINEKLVQVKYLTKCIELPTTSKESTSVTDPRKNTLIRRCRLQSKRFFARFRSWWWRRPIRKYKVNRVPSSVGAMYPLSPDARRRTTSFVNQRHIEPSSHPSLLKFSTISEAFLHSSLWKDIGSKVNIKKKF